jgi:hypothetical protein
MKINLGPYRSEWKGSDLIPVLGFALHDERADSYEYRNFFSYSIDTAILSTIAAVACYPVVNEIAKLA